jgi:molybdenum cofactor guanylyltransferase
MRRIAALPSCLRSVVTRRLLKILQTLLERAPAWCADNPVMGAWPADLAADALRFAENDPKRSVRGWARSIGAVTIACPPVANLNTPDDLAKLERG